MEALAAGMDSIGGTLSEVSRLMWVSSASVSVEERCRLGMLCRDFEGGLSISLDTLASGWRGILSGGGWRSAGSPGLRGASLVLLLLDLRFAGDGALGPPSFLFTALACCGILEM